MNDLDKFRVEEQARHRAGATHRTTPYSEAVNRYLGAFGYVDPYAPTSRPETAPPPAVAGTVTVGVDSSESSHVAVDHAAIEADLRGCALRLVHAGRDAQSSLLVQRLSERVRACAPRVAVSGRTTFGVGAAELLLADADPADLIVVGHRHGTFSRVLRRSVADRVATRHPGPVLVVGGAGWPTGPDLGARPLVVHADGTAALEQAAEFAMREARIRGCDVVLLQVADEPRDVPDRTERRAGVTVRHRTVVGDAATELIDSSHHACAVVLGRGPGRRLDRVGRTVLHDAHCPVFLAG